MQGTSTPVAQSHLRTDAWTGGAMFATLASFEELWITKAQYEEHGANLCHRKCL